MNLALLDPFRRQVPDRIDSTLSLPSNLHPPRPTNKKPLVVPRARGGLPSASTSPVPAPAASDEIAPAAAAAATAAEGKPKHVTEKKIPAVAASASADVEMKDVTESSAAGKKEEGGVQQEAVPPHAKESTTGSEAPGDASTNVNVKTEQEQQPSAPAKEESAKHTEEGTTTTTTSSSKKKRANWSIPAAEDWISCHAVSFNRRGTYVASGHLSGAVPVHDVLSRTLTAVHRPPPFGEGVESPPLSEQDIQKLKQEDAIEEQFEYRNGVTSLSWSRRSRLLLVAAVGDRNIRLVDNEHPLGVESVVVVVSDAAAAGGSSAAAAAAATTPAEGSRRAVASSPISVVTGDADKDDNEDMADGDDDGASSARSRSPKPSPTTSGSAKKRKKSSDANDKHSSTTPKQSLKATKEKISSSCAAKKDSPPNTARLLKYRILPPATVVDPSESVSNEDIEAHCQNYGLHDSLGGGDGTFPACRPAAGVAKTSPERPYGRYQSQILPLPNIVGASVQLHPRDCQAGLAVLADGSLVIFRFPLGGFVDGGDGGNASPSTATASELPSTEKQVSGELGKRGRLMYVVKPGSDYFVTDAVFGHSGGELYAVTKCGTLLGFCIGTDTWKVLRSPIALEPASASIGYGTSHKIPIDKPAFRVKIPGGAAAWQLVVSRNGRLILVNSADCALRLYGADECWESSGGDVAKDVKPRFVFQDLVSKIAWTSCDFSGDGEYVVGGCNSNPHMGDRYDLYLWNTGTGALIDQLTGPQVELHDTKFHPTRPFVAVATSDGIVDVWGPRMDWTAFAPDFQALPMNVEYVEKEDEFDVVVDGDNGGEERKRKEAEAKIKEEGKVVDVVTVDRVPVFDSDSEDEEDVFRFDTRIKHTMKSRPGPSASAASTTKDAAS